MASLLKSLKVGSSKEELKTKKFAVETVLTKPFTTVNAYIDFWEHMDSTNASNFVGALALKLLEVDKSKGHSRSEGSEIALGVSNSAALATMLQLIMYYPVSADDERVQVLTRKLANSAPSPPQPDGLSLDTMLQMVGRADKLDFLMQMVQICSDVELPSKLGVHEGPSALSSSLLFAYLQRCVLLNTQGAKIIQALHKILTLGHVGVSTSRALAVLHMLQHLLLCFPRLTPEEIEAMRADVSKLRTWAQPVGPRAMTAVRMIDAEGQLRTASIWLSLHEQVPWLARVDESMLGSATGVEALVDSFTAWLITDETTDWGRSFAALVMIAEPHRLDEPGASSISAVPVFNALCSMLFAIFQHATPPLSVGPGKLATLSFATVAQLAARAMNLAISASRGQPVGDSLRGLAATVMAATHDSSPSSSHALQQPRLPPPVLRTLESGRQPGADAAVVRELREAAEVAGRYAYDPLLLSLHEQLLARAELVQRGAPPLPLRVCAAGGDATLHKLLQAYVVLRCAYGPLCDAALVRVYVVPTGRSNRLASFIAHYDGWYRRHIFAHYAHGQPTVPHLILPATPIGFLSTSHRTSADHFPAPALASEVELPRCVSPLHSCLSHYLLSASSVMHMQLWSVQCWLSPPADGATTSEPPFVTFAFCESVDLALNSQSEGGGGGGGGGSPLSVTYTVADPWGVSYNASASLSGRFVALTFAACATDPVHLPSSGRLQMRASQAKTGGAKAADGPLRYVRSASVSVGAAAAAGGEGGTSKGKTPRFTSDRFSVVVDGETYGPFAFVVLTPCVRPGGSEAVTLPVATFFPVDSVATA